jgi:hypothetical protein
MCYSPHGRPFLTRGPLSSWTSRTHSTPKFGPPSGRGPSILVQASLAMAQGPSQTKKRDKKMLNFSLAGQKKYKIFPCGAKKVENFPLRDKIGTFAKKIDLIKGTPSQSSGPPPPWTSMGPSFRRYPMRPSAEAPPPKGIISQPWQHVEIIEQT